jgi:hypothetical protein
VFEQRNISAAARKLKVDVDVLADINKAARHRMSSSPAGLDGSSPYFCDRAVHQKLFSFLQQIFAFDTFATVSSSSFL